MEMAQQKTDQPKVVHVLQVTQILISHYYNVTQITPICQFFFFFLFFYKIFIKLKMDKVNEVQILTELELNNLKICDKNSNSVNINHKNCSYCNKPFTEELWCKECDPRCMIEGWTSGNNDIDKFIKDTIYDARNDKYNVKFLEWVPFDRFKDIKQIGEGGFAKVYSATWIDGKAEYYKQNGEWKKKEPQPIKVALKRLNGSQNISAEYLNEVCFVLNLHFIINV
jgi:hypothetical protein